MSKATEIYDRIIQMEMQRALDNARYQNRLDQQQIISDAGTDRTRIQQNQATKRQGIISNTNYQKKLIDQKISDYKASQETARKNFEVQSDNEEKIKENEYDMKEAIRKAELENQYKNEKLAQDKDESLIREGQYYMDSYQDVLKNNPRVYPMQEKKWKDPNKRWYTMNDEGQKIYMSEKQKYALDENNEAIDNVLSAIINGHSNISTIKNLRRVKVSDLTPAQKQALKDRKSKSGNTNWKIDKTKGLVTRDDNKTMSELASQWSNRLTNDSIPIGSFPTGTYKDIPPVGGDFGKQRAFGSATKTLPDENPSNKGGITAGANQGVNTGKSQLRGAEFRRVIGDSSTNRYQR